MSGKMPELPRRFAKESDLVLVLLLDLPSRL
jgi:hypothetical protein